MRVRRVEARLRHNDDDGRGTGNRSPVDYCGSICSYNSPSSVIRFEFCQLLTTSNNENNKSVCHYNNTSNYYCKYHNDTSGQ